MITPAAPSSSEVVYAVSSDPQLIDVVAAHAFLSRSHWSAGIPLETVAKAVANSLCFGVFQAEAQVGFARVVTDKATFAYLCDVYVLDAHRGQGLSKRLMQAVQAHPELQGLRRVMLATKDAHGLYAQFGFEPLSNPSRLMEVLRPDVYQQR
jgi:GNAT superfamily N-acetyltransferase